MSLINRQAVRRHALELSRSQRLGKFTRVSREFLDSVEAAVRSHIAAQVRSHPSKGRTLYGN